MFSFLLIPELTATKIKGYVEGCTEFRKPIIIASKNPSVAVDVNRDLIHGNLISGMLQYEPDERICADDLQKGLIES